MSEKELTEQSEIFYYALVTSRAASVLTEFERTGEVPSNDRGNLEQCHQIMKQIAQAQPLVEARTEKIVPDLESIQLYQNMLEAVGSRDIIEPGENLGQAADKFAATLKEIISGKLFAEINTHELDQLRKAVGALASVYSSKTAVSIVSKRSRSIFKLPL